jgi:glycosyltransferase involved in cell wall biosynthesis
MAGASASESTVDYFTFRKLLRVIRDKRIDVVHTHTTHGLVDAGICKMLRPGLKVVHTFHFGNYPHTWPRIIWMERIFSRVADRLIAVGEVQRRQLLTVLRLSEPSIDVLWNGVPIPAGSQDQSYRDVVRSGGRTVIGTIATFIEQKGLPDLLRVARRVIDAGHNVLFVVVGEGRLRRDLEALRSELHLEQHVLFPGWVTNAADVALPAFDIFFQPSRWEAMSVVILEAMANAKPIVATRVGENPHILEHGVDGVLVDVGDIEGMSVAISGLLRDADLCRSMGTSARAKVEARFSVARMTRAYEDLYRELTR